VSGRIGNDHGEEPTAIAEILAHVAHFVPEQAPLHTFVHHNTLHAFEHLPFDRAVVAAAKLFGAEPYQSEAAFAAHLRSGRILSVDCDAVLADELDRDGSVQGLARQRCFDFRRTRLRHLFEAPRGPALQWQLHETGLFDRCHPSADAARQRLVAAWADRRGAGLPPARRLPTALRGLWDRLAAAAPMVARPAALRGIRRRDQLVLACADDVDQRVHPLLIRLCAAFLDQGVALWHMPDRERGFLAAVRALYGLRAPAPDLWAAGLAAEFRRQEEAGEDAEATILHALDDLGVTQAQRCDFVRDTLMSLGGWAGMTRQFETRPDRAPVQPLPARLADHLAVQLTLDAVAARHALRERWGPQATWADLERAVPAAAEERDLELAFEAFVMAQVADVDLEALDATAGVAAWLDEVRAFDELERRRCLHLAYERRLRLVVLDGLANHAATPPPAPPAPPAPTFQAIFCIDDRECSTRRHLEESHVAVQTFGFAGFFGVAMAWQGLGEVRPRPLCPVVVTPKHYVTERALRTDEEQRWLEMRRRRGLRSAVVGRASREAAAGSLLSAVTGLAAAVPMVGRCLFPHLAERLSRGLKERNQREPVTRLVLERAGDERTADGLWVGYSVSEMADVVENCLRTIGLVDGLCEIVLVVGHGSSSLNNPHGSAYDCGATGGGRGGPNARAFAAMANHPQVRALLAGRGLRIPEATWFVGSYHNTCDDSMTWYDEDLMPDARAAALEAAKRAMADACTLEAHERCRRFVSAPRTDDAVRALRHVQARAVDLGQPRPECGHATNAYAIVGRRERTRGLFLDRRAFLVSYDPAADPDGAILGKVLGAVVPVGAGINLEYYFSYVDPKNYGCGTKLPHNITGLIGVMDGHASDLRTGLPWQMVEIHEPVRLLAVIEAEPETDAKVMARDATVAQLVQNQWIQAVVWSPSTGVMHEFVHGGFRPYRVDSRVLPTVGASPEFYSGQIESLGCARTTASFGGGELTGGRR
jgi:uncharacterized protein YbcC (UPF0753/DUF2309 family)